MFHTYASSSTSILSFLHFQFNISIHSLGSLLVILHVAGCRWNIAGCRYISTAHFLHLQSTIPFLNCIFYIFIVTHSSLHFYFCTFNSKFHSYSLNSIISFFRFYFYISIPRLLFLQFHTCTLNSTLRLMPFLSTFPLVCRQVYVFHTYNSNYSTTTLLFLHF